MKCSPRQAIGICTRKRLRQAGPIHASPSGKCQEHTVVPSCAPGGPTLGPKPHTYPSHPHFPYAYPPQDAQIGLLSKYHKHKPIPKTKSNPIPKAIENPPIQNYQTKIHSKLLHLPANQAPALNLLPKPLFLPRGYFARLRRGRLSPFIFSGWPRLELGCLRPPNVGEEQSSLQED